MEKELEKIKEEITMEGKFIRHLDLDKLVKFLYK